MASFSSLRATSATEKPEEPNFSAAALEMPGPNPTTRMVFPMGRSDEAWDPSVAPFSTAERGRMTTRRARRSQQRDRHLVRPDPELPCLWSPLDDADRVGNTRSGKILSEAVDVGVHMSTGSIAAEEARGLSAWANVSRAEMTLQTPRYRPIWA
jgi:hypothetical protein